MNVVDTSGWIEFLFRRPNGAAFRAVLSDPESLIVPTITIHEVTRFVTRAFGRDAVHNVVRQLQRATVIDLDPQLAVESARLGHRYNLALADSIIYATAQVHRATLYTQDADLAKLPSVKYIRPK